MHQPLAPLRWTGQYPVGGVGNLTRKTSGQKRFDTWKPWVIHICLRPVHCPVWCFRRAVAGAVRSSRLGIVISADFSLLTFPDSCRCASACFYARSHWVLPALDVDLTRKQTISWISFLTALFERLSLTTEKKKWISRSSQWGNPGCSRIFTYAHVC
jgi:hypothetical protein